MKDEEIDVILIGRAPVMNYIVATITLFRGGAQRVIVKARGRAIGRAVDVVEVLRGRFMLDVKVKTIDIGTQQMPPREEGGVPTNVSTIEIELVRIIPYLQETIDFFEQAGFSLVRRSLRSFTIESPKRDFSRYGGIMMTIKTSGVVSGEDIRDLYEDLKKTYGSNLNNKIVFLVVASPPVGGAIPQIMAYKWDLGLTLVPLSVQRIVDALKDESCYETASDTLRTYTGRANLYEISVPIVDPVLFFGRDKIIDEVLDYVYQGQSVGIFSMRKMGKTSLLHQLKHRLSEKRGPPVAYLDLQSVTRNLPMLLRSIMMEIITDIRFKYPLLELSNLETQRHKSFDRDPIRTFKQTILRLYHLVSEVVPDVKFMLILDEIDRLFPRKDYEGFEGYEDFLALIRGISQQHGFLSTTISGVDPYLNRFHDLPTFQFFKEIWLPPLKKEETKKMIEELGGWMGISYDDESLEKIMEESGCHPFITRMLCGNICELLGKRTNVVANDVVLGIERFYKKHSDYLEGLLYSFLVPEERELLMVISTHEGPFPRASLSSEPRILNRLEQLHFVSTKENAVKIPIGLLNRWIRSHSKRGKM